VRTTGACERRSGRQAGRLRDGEEAFRGFRRILAEAKCLIPAKMPQYPEKLNRNERYGIAIVVSIYYVDTTDRGVWAYAQERSGNLPRPKETTYARNDRTMG